MKKWIFPLALILAICFGVQTVVAETEDNAIKAEMRLLDKAFKNAIDGLLLNMPEIIEPPFHEVQCSKNGYRKGDKKGCSKTAEKR